MKQGVGLNVQSVKEKTQQQRRKYWRRKERISGVQSIGQKKSNHGRTGGVVVCPEQRKAQQSSTWAKAPKSVIRKGISKEKQKGCLRC